MKFMAIQHHTSINVRFRATSYGEFFSFLNEVAQHNEENIWNYYVENVMVSYDQAVSAVNQAFDDAKAKKEITHKQVKVSQGATCLPNTYLNVWVKK